MQQTTGPPQIAAAAVLTREDGQVLLVRYRADDEQFAGLWSLPMAPVANVEVAEDAVARVLLDQLHVTPGACEFAETIYFAGAAGARYIVNVFTCTGWDGEPRFAERHFDDAAWVRAGGYGSLPLIPELAAWLPAAFGAPTPAGSAALASALDEARRELLAAYEAIPAALRERPLDGGWSPLDVLAHTASVEGYYAAEVRRMLETPGHTWRAFNAGQWEDEHRSRAPEPERAVRARLADVREGTSAWLEALSEEQLAAYGNHAERGAVTVADRLDKIARHDHEHAAQLRAMAGRA